MLLPAPTPCDLSDWGDGAFLGLGLRLSAGKVMHRIKLGCHYNSVRISTTSTGASVETGTKGRR